MDLVKLSDEEMDQTIGGELTLSSILAVMCIGVVTVICYRLLRSNTGKTTLPGGFTFSWT